MSFYFQHIYKFELTCKFKEGWSFAKGEKDKGAEDRCCEMVVKMGHVEGG